MGVIGIIIILASHFVADFLCQSREMANKKSKSIRWLSEHVATYALVCTIVYTLLALPALLEQGKIGIYYFQSIVYFLAITFVTHWITDFFMSKWTSRLYKSKEEWKFFSVIGFDQFIHTSTLLLTYEYMLA